MKLENYILKKLRQRADLDENDTSKDAEFEARSPMRNFREVIGWEMGDPGWAEQFISWGEAVGAIKAVED